ncbi:hypothetical protein Y032_0147g2611 [Ancylostoma ceylanicum]|uniref:Uncharacterized protein n=1 Tax=Ancylostoma ceylanicum TaxID=53326 RepID=A0A016T276_9BILA|nr:hypothetical protein Y032_0147g2611 [Ancylostoma ceylanicum]
MKCATRSSPTIYVQQFSPNQTKCTALLKKIDAFRGCRIAVEPGLGLRREHAPTHGTYSNDLLCVLYVRKGVMDYCKVIDYCIGVGEDRILAPDSLVLVF